MRLMRKNQEHKIPKGQKLLIRSRLLGLEGPYTYMYVYIIFCIQ